MSLRIGINPNNWSNDDFPELGAGVSFGHCLASAARAGYVGVELGNKFPRDAAALADALAQQRLALVSGWHSLQLLNRSVQSELTAMQDHLGLLRALGSELVICAETVGAVHQDPARSLGDSPQLDRSQWSALARQLAGLADRLGERAMTLAYHPHVGTVVQSEQDIDRLMELVPDCVKLVLDTGHLAFAGCDPARIATRHADRIAHIHCKDVRRPVLSRAQQRGWSFHQSIMAGVFAMPGDGDLDFAGILCQLPQYRGWLVAEAEQDPDRSDPDLSSARGLRHLAGIVHALGRS
jgi:inosose dehydratase